MTSHITVSTSQSTGATTGFTSSLSGDGSQSSGGFGALVDALTNLGASMAGTAATSGKATPTTGFVLPGTATTDAAEATANAAALAEALAGKTADTLSAPLAATQAVDAAADAATTAAGTPPQLLRELVTSLSALDKAEKSGAPIDQDLLKRVKKAIDALSGFLAAQQAVPSAPAAASPAATGSAVAAIGAAGTGAAAAGATPAAGQTPSSATDSSDATVAARAALTGLDGKLEALSATLAKTAPDLSAQLAALAKSLEPSKLSTDTLGQLGLGGKTDAADPTLTAAINGLVNGKSQPTTGLQPALGSPELKLPGGTALGDPASSSSGKETSSGASDARPAPTQPAQASTSAAGGQSGTSTGGGAGGGKPDPATPSAAVVAAHAAVDPARTDSSPAGATSSLAVPPTSMAGAATPAQAAAAATAPIAAYSVNLSQLAFEISRHVQQGNSHFQIRLDPADLGRVDVKLAFDSSGALNARVTAERPETLALLQRDAGSLGQALSQAGLDGARTSLQFSLSQNPFTRQDGGNSNAPTYLQATEDDTSIDPIAATSATTLYRGTTTPNGLNIVV